MSNTAAVSNQQVTQLLSGASMLSQQSLDVLNVNDIGNSIKDALATPVLESAATEALLIGVMVDDSGSIAMARNDQAIRDGVNAVVEALKGAGDAVDIQFFLRYLNGQILHPFGDLDTVPKLTTANYNPNEGTPLFDETKEFLKAVVARTQQFDQWDVPVRTMSLIVTDGHDMHSRAHTAAHIKSIVIDLMATENHIVAGMGVDDGSGIDFRTVFSEMGIPDQWIYETGPKSGESQDEFLRRIRRGFQLFSKSAVRASKSAVNFSQLGGFGN